MSISLLLLFQGHLSRRFLNVANFDSFFFKLAYYGVCVRQSYQNFHWHTIQFKFWAKVWEHRKKWLYSHTYQNPKYWRWLPGAQEWLPYTLRSNFPCVGQKDLVRRCLRLQKLAWNRLNLQASLLERVYGSPGISSLENCWSDNA